LDPLLTGLFSDRLGPVRDWLTRMRILVHREIPDPSPERRRSLRVDRLLEVPFELVSVDEARQLDGLTLTSFAKPLIAGECVAGFRLRTAFQFGHARTVKDNLE